MVDHTVNAHALVKAFYDKLPANGSELVLFDINRTENLDLLMASSAETALSSLLGPSPRNYRVTVISNAGRSDGAVAERVTEPGSTAEIVRSLGLRFPPGVLLSLCRTSPCRFRQTTPSTAMSSLSAPSRNSASISELPPYVAKRAFSW